MISRTRSVKQPGRKTGQGNQPTVRRRKRKPGKRAPKSSLADWALQFLGLVTLVAIFAVFLLSEPRHEMEPQEPQRFGQGIVDFVASMKINLAGHR